jgi:hypothetical protein
MYKVGRESLKNVVEKIWRCNDNIKLFMSLEYRLYDIFISVAEGVTDRLKGLRNSHNQSLMHIAAVAGNKQVVTLLLDNMCGGLNKDVSYLE